MTIAQFNKALKKAQKNSLHTEADNAKNILECQCGCDLYVSAADLNLEGNVYSKIYNLEDGSIIIVCTPDEDYYFVESEIDAAMKLATDKVCEFTEAYNL